MGLCSWPRGCSQDAHDGVRCYYHSKVVDGLIEADWYLLEARTGKPSPERRMRLAAVLDEQGASPDVITAALQVPMFPRHHSRHGYGVIRTGTLRTRAFHV